MIEKIGTNAGTVWTVLSQTEGAVCLKDLKKKAKLTEKDMYAALGWLAREGKVVFSEGEADMFVALA